MTIQEADPSSGSTASLAGDLARGAVQVVARNTGRGPTKVRAYVNDDLVTIILRDLLTVSERTLVTNGHDAPVLAARRAMQAVMEQEFIELVQSITGRSVIAFLSANHFDPDIEIESLVLAPAA